MFPGHLRAVPDQKAGVARELVPGLRDNLDDKFFSDYFPAWNAESFSIIGGVEFPDDAARVRGVGGLQCLQ